jgi:hypothetical protein
MPLWLSLNSMKIKTFSSRKAWRNYQDKNKKTARQLYREKTRGLKHD